jgi:hypothetical protein
VICKSTRTADGFGVNVDVGGTYTGVLVGGGMYTSVLVGGGTIRVTVGDDTTLVGATTVLVTTGVFGNGDVVGAGVPVSYDAPGVR